MNRLDTTVREGPEGVLVALRGELDIAAAHELESELERLAKTGASPIVLDLREVTFIDSSGLRLILAAHQRARDSGRRLALVRGPERVQRVFEIALLDQRLEFVADATILGLATPSASA